MVKVPAVLDGVSPLKDGGMSLRFHTQELKPEEKLILMNKYQGFGWLAFADYPEVELPQESPTREAGQKTPSQRLRASLYKVWENRYADIPFNVWYEQQMEKIINTVKGRI